MRILINGVRLFFDVEGPELVPEGRDMRKRNTLLLLHGGPGFDHTSFKPIFSELSNLVQIIYLDHRGNGRSDRGPSQSCNLAQWANDLRTFCEVLGIEQPIVFGQSFGGFVAMEYAIRFPDHPGKLILSSTHARLRLDRVYEGFGRLGGPKAEEAARSFFKTPTRDTLAEYAKVCFPRYNQTPQDPAVIARMVQNPELLCAFVREEWRNFDYLPGLAGIKTPTLVIVGEEDPITPVSDAVDIANALPSGLARFVRFPGCGHGVFRDKPEECFKILRQFIQNE